MKKANAVDLRKCLDAAQEMAKAGFLFVPLPVVSQTDYEALIVSLDVRLKAIENMCEEES